MTDWKEFNKCYDGIADDDSGIENMLNELKENYRTGVTRDLSFRKK